MTQCKRTPAVGIPLTSHWPRKEVWGCAALKTPFSCLSRSSQGSHFKQKSLKVSSQDPLLRKKIGNFSLFSLNFCPNFSSQGPKFEHFSSQDTRPLFQKQKSVRKPCTLRKSGPHIPTWKKVQYLPRVAKFEFKVTVHYGLWAKSTQLWHLTL